MEPWSQCWWSQCERSTFTLKFMRRECMRLIINQYALEKGFISYSYVHGYTNWLQAALSYSYIKACWSNSSPNQRRFCPLAPLHPLLLSLHVPLAICTAAAVCRAALRMGMPLEWHQFFVVVVFELKSDIFNLDHLNDLIPTQPNKQLHQHNCHASGGI